MTNENLAKVNLNRDAGQILSEKLLTVRARSAALCAPLQTEDYCIQGMPDVSPPKWHLAHTTWFFETFVLVPFMPGYAIFNSAYAYLFNSYYETAGTFFPRHQRGLLARPTVAEIYQYRTHVDHALEQLLAGPLTPNKAEVMTRVRLGIEHEIQHQELLLMDIKYNFFINPLRPAYHRALPSLCVDPPRLSWAEFSGGIIETGHAGEEFSYDNERPRHQVFLRDFCLATRLVTNAEYLNFIADAGYQRPELWLSDGWRVINTLGWRAPLYWIEQDGGPWQMSLTGLQPLAAHEPVAHLSYYEADAYARWAGRRLPTEAEWEHAAATQTIAGNFLDSGRLHPECAPRAGLSQLYGDLWEWTQSAYLPYPGFSPLPGSLGEYNGKFMCNQMVLRGGSCATAQEHIRASYRNFFPPESRWAFSGVRLAGDL
ncbi:MAG: ergothioneine biosynthesis protein EgtB [Pseudomonadota bacterium]